MRGSFTPLGHKSFELEGYGELNPLAHCRCHGTRELTVSQKDGEPLELFKTISERFNLQAGHGRLGYIRIRVDVLDY